MHSVRIAERGDELVDFWAPFPYALMLPFDDLRGMGRMAQCVLGAAERTPHSESQLSNRGVVNGMQKISKGRFVAVFGGPENIQLLSRFIAEHYGIAFKFHPAFRGRSGLTLFEAEPVENE